jgi:hypothetical protein
MSEPDSSLAMGVTEILRPTASFFGAILLDSQLQRKSHTRAVDAFETLQGGLSNQCYYSIHSLDADSISWLLFEVLPDLSVLVDNKGWGGC